MRIVVASDKFKGSLTSLQAGRAMADGLRQAFPDADIAVVPVADGGDGTAQALVDALGGRWVSRRACGPDGKQIEASFGMLGERQAVVELAQASGLALVPPGSNDPLRATTYGTGELIAAAIEAGAKRVILAIGGSATNDAGAGALEAMGARFLDASGASIARGGAALAKVDRIDTTGLDRRLQGVAIEIASDVDNPLCGPDGASAVYGPQKGASPQDVAVLDRALANFASVAARATGVDVRNVPGAGAAGGIGGGFLALAGATLRPGAEIVLEAVGLVSKLHGASLVVTGEGRLDRQTLAGKAPMAVARAAKKFGVPCVAIAGRVDCSLDDLDAMGLLTALPIVSGPMTEGESKDRAVELTASAAARLGRALIAGRQILM